MVRHFLVALVLVSMVTVSHAQGGGHQVCMLVPQSTQECFRSFEGKSIRDLAAKISCLQDLLWNAVPDPSLDDKDMSFLRNISASLSGTAGKRPMEAGFTSRRGSAPGVPQAAHRRSSEFLYPPSGYRVRKEYRTLNPDERARFHSALQRLYRDGFIETFAKIHAQAGIMHHGGASFLPWHRIYLIIFEEALRLYDIKVSLPYWASTYDDEMDNPVNSVLWTPRYFGNGEGIVTSGPAAYWVTAQGGLERDFGKASTLFKREHIQQVLSQCRLANISRPTAEWRFDFEGYQDGPHVWVGGDMGAFATAGYDPVFYMHHAYIDLIWERFRKRQRMVCGVEPGKDYPEVPAGDSNHPDAPMTGFDWFSNKDGISPHWTNNWYSYEQEPRCPDCCPGCMEPAPLYCDVRSYECKARSKLVDETGQINRTAMIEASARSMAMGAGPVRAPRNRGRMFDGPPSDGRTVFTAARDAMTAALQSPVK